MPFSLTHPKEWRLKQKIDIINGTCYSIFLSLKYIRYWWQMTLKNVVSFIWKFIFFIAKWRWLEVSCFFFFFCFFWFGWSFLTYLIWRIPNWKTYLRRRIVVRFDPRVGKLSCLRGSLEKPIGTRKSIHVQTQRCGAIESCFFQ